MENDGEFLYDYPSCSYLVRLTLQKLREAVKDINQDEARRIIRRFADFMEFDIWNSGSSTVSSVLDISTQVEFMKYVAMRMVDMAKILREGKYERYLAIEDCWKKDFNSFLGHVQALSTRPRLVKGAHVRLDGKLKTWEKKFGELVNEYGLVMEADKPLFVLKSGYRSMYFFNPSHLISRSNINGQKNQEIMSKFKEVLKLFIGHLKTELKEKNIAFLLTQKIGGEDPGTSQFGPLFTDLGIPVHYLGAYLDALKGPVIEDTQLLIVPFDGVTTTGKTVDTIIERFRKIIKQKPRVYSLIWNRSPHTHRKSVPILSIAPHLTPLPEILRLSINSFDSNLGHWWFSLTMFHDYLKDIYLYSEKSIRRYNATKTEFEKLIIDSYEIKEKQSKPKEKTAYLFGYFDTNESLESITRYLMNLNILCWNAIFDIRFEDENSRLKNAVDYVETMLNMEKTERPILNVCPILLKKGLKSHESKSPRLIDPWDVIHRIFVRESENISEYILGNEVLRTSPYDLRASKIRQALLIVTLRDLLSDNEREGLYEIRENIKQRLENPKSYDVDLDKNLLALIDKIMIKHYEEGTKKKLIEHVGIKRATELEKIKIPP